MEEEDQGEPLYLSASVTPFTCLAVNESTAILTVDFCTSCRRQASPAAPGAPTLRPRRC